MFSAFRRAAALTRGTSGAGLVNAAIGIALVSLAALALGNLIHFMGRQRQQAAAAFRLVAAESELLAALQDKDNFGPLATGGAVAMAGQDLHYRTGSGAQRRLIGRFGRAVFLDSEGNEVPGAAGSTLRVETAI